MSADFGAWEEEPEGRDPLVAQLTDLALNPWAAVQRRWIWMLPVLLLGLAGTAAIPYLTVPTYEANATVLISSQQIPEQFVRSTVSGMDSLANVNALMGEVLSQRVLGQLIEKHGLFGESRLSVPLDELVAQLRRQVQIKQQRTVASRSSQETSSIYSITHQSTDPTLAAKVANDLAGIFVDASIEKRSEQAHLTTEFLRRELVRSEGELRESNRKIAEFQAEHRGEMPGDQEGLLRKLERLELQRQTITNQIASAEARLMELRSTDRAGRSTPELKLVELKLRLAEQLSYHTDEHPTVIALRRQIETLETQVGEINSLLAESDTPTLDLIGNAERELEMLRNQLDNTAKGIVEIDARVARIPYAQEQLNGLLEREKVLRENYTSFLRKVQDAELAETLESAQQGPRVSILDRASPPRQPMHSIRAYVLMSLMAAVGGAIGVGLLLELVDPIVLSSEHFDVIGHPPLLGSIYETTEA